MITINITKINLIIIVIFRNGSYISFQQAKDDKPNKPYDVYIIPYDIKLKL
jgi:hypothetical protein